MSTASKPFSYDYHTYYPLKATPVLPLIVPNNDNWKQIAGDAMYEWVMMFHGDMTGQIVAMILNHLSILEIRCMLQDFNHLMLRAGQAQQTLLLRATPVVQTQAVDTKLKAIIEDDSEDTVSTDMSFVQEKENPRERLDTFLGSLGH